MNTLSRWVGVGAVWMGFALALLVLAQDGTAKTKEPPIPRAKQRANDGRTENGYFLVQYDAAANRSLMDQARRNLEDPKTPMLSRIYAAC